NRRGAAGPVPLDPRFFHLLRRAAALSEATGGAFDPTVGPLVRCWGFAGQGGRVPSPEEVADALAVVGAGPLRVDAEAFRLAFERYSHVLDPRTGRPVRAALLAAVVTDSPTDADALSTALLTLGEEGLSRVTETSPDAGALIAVDAPGGNVRVVTAGAV